MKTNVVRGGGLFLVGALASAVALAAGGCSDDPVPATEVDSGPSTDSGLTADTSNLGDGGTSDVQTSDANDSGPIGPQPVLLNLSPGGHDRLFGVTYDAAGNLYATGVASTAATTTADLSFLVAKFTPAGVLDATFGTNGVATLNVVAA